MKKSLLMLLILVILPRTCEAEEDATNKNDAKSGVVTAHSRGLHGYIGYSASRPDLEARIVAFLILIAPVLECKAFRRTAVFKCAIGNQLGIEPAVHAVVYLFEKDPIH